MDSSSFQLLDVSKFAGKRYLLMSKILGFLKEENAEPVETYNQFLHMYINLAIHAGEMPDDNDSLKKILMQGHPPEMFEAMIARLKECDKTMHWYIVYKADIGPPPDNNYGIKSIHAVAMLRNGSTEDTFNLVTFYIVQQDRQCGIGTRLLNLCVEAAKQMGKKTIVTDSLVDMPMLQFFCKREFKLMPASLRKDIVIGGRNPETLAQRQAYVMETLTSLASIGQMTEKEKEAQTVLDSGSMSKKTFETHFGEIIDTSGAIPVIWLHRDIA